MQKGRHFHQLWKLPPEVSRQVNVMSLKWPSARVNHKRGLKTWPKNKVPSVKGLHALKGFLHFLEGES